MALKVNEQSDPVKRMAEEWALAAALLGGTKAMRAAGHALLPKWANEEPLSYANRLATATLFPAFARTLGVMAGKPFAKQITLGDDVPSRLVPWLDDCDLMGTNLHGFGARLFAGALGYGLAGILVDCPTTNGTLRTAADEATAGVRPYFVLVRHDQILGWKAGKINGVVTLTQLRLMESREADDGAFGTVCIPRIRVLEPGKYTIYEENERKEWAISEGGVTSLSRIPFVPFYGRQVCFMEGASPLQDLAYLNIKHWQSQSDQDTILHVARVPILAMIGVDEEGADGQGGPKLTIGASSAVRLPLNGDMKYVEHTGAAIDSGEKSLEKLEGQMIQTGAELLVEKPGQRSATESSNDAEANKSDLQRMVEGFEDSLDQALQLMADWVKEPEGGHVSLFKDFGAANLSDASAQLVLAMQAQGLITKKTAITEQQRRGMLSPDLVPEDELAAVEEEGPPLGTLGGPRDDHAILPAPGPADTGGGGGNGQ